MAMRASPRAEPSPELDLGGERRLRLDDGATLLPGRCLAEAGFLLDAVGAIAARSPFRHYRTPGGRRIGTAMTAAGPLGWISDARGYRYEPVDPATGRPWPPLPAALAGLATDLAAEAGHPGFRPDTLLVNRYAAGTGMGLHRDEAEMAQPIVSLSLGLPATFLWAGGERGGPTRRIPLAHGDAVIWGGAARLARHGIAPLRAGHHPATQAFRYNLTFRRARPLEQDG